MASIGNASSCWQRNTISTDSQLKIYSVFRGPRSTLTEIVKPLFGLLIVDIYICLLMHALVGEDDKIVVDDDDIASIRHERNQDKESAWTKIKKAIGLGRHAAVDDVEAQKHQDDDLKLESVPIAQHYTPERNIIYEEVRASRPSNLTVAVEQVSMFLTGDRTLITFFQVRRPSGRC